MESAAELSVPLNATPKVGYTWGSMRELKKIDATDFESALKESFAATQTIAPAIPEQKKVQENSDLTLLEAWNELHPSQQLPVDSIETEQTRSALTACRERLYFIQSFLKTIKNAPKFSALFLNRLAAASRIQLGLSAAPFPYGDEEIDYGVTKIGGSADIPAVWIDKYLTEEGGVIPLSLLQLNLSSLPQCRDLSTLPQGGMLYVFQRMDRETRQPGIQEIRFWSGGVVPDVDVVRLGPSFGFEYQGEALIPLTPQTSEVKLCLDFAKSSLEILRSEHGGDWDTFQKCASAIVAQKDRELCVGGFLPDSDSLAIVSGCLQTELGPVSVAIPFSEEIFKKT
jgi:hypothetical protein